MQKDLNRKMGQATKWSAITEICTKLIAPVTNAILARILVPEVFGVVATLTMVTSFAEIFTDAGFQKYLVQHEFADEDDLNLSTNVAFWTNICFSILVWGAIVVFATPIANAVGSAGHELSIAVMSAQIPLVAISSIQMARYRRDLDFKNLFYSRVAIALVPLLITVPAALLLRSYWALVFGTLVKDILNAVILTVRSKWKPRWEFDWQKLKDMASFSIWTVLENVTIWLSTNAGTFIVGSILGSYYLGLYKTTITTVAGYFNVISSITMPVLFSALSRCQQNDEAFREVMFQFQRLTAMLVLPLGFGVLVYRDLVTLILLGSQWTETADFVGLFALFTALVLIFSYFNSEAFRSKGRPMLSVATQVLYIIVLFPALYFSARQSYEILSFASALSRMMIIAASSMLASLALKIRFRDVLKNVWPSLFASVIMALFGSVARGMIPHIAWEVFTVILCVVIYASCLIAIPSSRRQLAQIPVVGKVLHKLFGKWGKRIC